MSNCIWGAEEVTGIRVFGNNSQSFTFAFTANHDWWVGFLDRFRIAVGGLKFVVFAVEVCRFLGPHLLDDLDCFFEAFETFLCWGKWDSVGVGFFLVPTCSDAHEESSFTHD